MQYAELYNESLLKKLHEKGGKQVLDGLDTVNTEKRVDVRQIAEKLGLEIVEKPMLGESGKLEDKKIYIDATEPEERKRFTIGHEIGHYIVGGEVEHRYDSSAVYSGEEMRNEKIANAYAAQILMPVKLVYAAIISAIDNFKINKEDVSEDDFTKIIDFSSHQLNVSKPALRYRVKNLQVFSE